MSSHVYGILYVDLTLRMDSQACSRGEGLEAAAPPPPEMVDF